MRETDELVGLDRLPPRRRVLDLGCGSGLPVLRAIVDRGHAGVGMDVSRDQLARARANVPEAELVRASALELQLAPESLDAVVALYVADHIERDCLPALFAAIRSWLRECGWLLITFETGDEPGTVGTWLGLPMFFSSHDAATTQRLLGASGFQIAQAEPERQREGDREVEYLWILARKPKSDIKEPLKPPGDPFGLPHAIERSAHERTSG